MLKDPNSKLAQNIWKKISKQTVLDRHEELKHFSRRQLVEEAAKERARQRAEFEKRYPPEQTA